MVSTKRNFGSVMRPMRRTTPKAFSGSPKGSKNAGFKMFNTYDKNPNFFNITEMNVSYLNVSEGILTEDESFLLTELGENLIY